MNKRNRLILTFALSTYSCQLSDARSPPVPGSIDVETAPLVLLGDIGSILVLVDRLPGKETFAESGRAEQAAIRLAPFLRADVMRARQKRRTARERRRRGGVSGQKLLNG